MSAEPIVLLDLDDTLLDFKKAEARALSQSLTEIFSIGNVWKTGN